MFTISITITIFLLAGIAQAQDKMTTPAEAKELHKKIVEHVRKVGCGKSIPGFNNTKRTMISEIIDCGAPHEKVSFAAIHQGRR